MFGKMEGTGKRGGVEMEKQGEEEAGRDEERGWVGRDKDGEREGEVGWRRGG